MRLPVCPQVLDGEGESLVQIKLERGGGRPGDGNCRATANACP